MSVIPLEVIKALVSGLILTGFAPEITMSVRPNDMSR